MINKKVILLIMDGFGEGEENISNPFRFAKTKTLNYLQTFFPFCLLNASGYAVGLPPGKAPSCEIGHLHIGTGITYYQPKVKIDIAIENGEFFKNEILIKLFNHGVNFKSKIHLVGLLSENTNIASIDHLLAILEFAKKQNFDNIYIHLFTDGIDSEPKSALKLIENLKQQIQSKNLPGKIGTLCGRFYALDETNNYFIRTQRVFLLLVENNGNLVNNLNEFLSKKYEDYEFNDSILEPIVVNPQSKIEDGDAILFFNHESKSIFQLANAFLNPNFKEFKRPAKKNLYIASMTKYIENLNYPVVFEPQKIKNNLTKIISENKLNQLKIIDETRKNLLQYYFNGLFEESHPGEVFKIFPPITEQDPDENLIPRTIEIFDYLKIIIKENFFDFIVLNIPIFDIVGYKSNFKLAIQIIERFDELLGNFLDFLSNNHLNKYSLIITSDHGNIEKLIEPRFGKKDKSRNPNPVPFYLIDEKLKKEKTKNEILFFKKRTLGSLIDIAPTILNLMGIKIPKDFEGQSLIKYFQYV